MYAVLFEILHELRIKGHSRSL